MEFLRIRGCTTTTTSLSRQSANLLLPPFVLPSFENRPALLDPGSTLPLPLNLPRSFPPLPFSPSFSLFPGTTEHALRPRARPPHAHARLVSRRPDASHSVAPFCSPRPRRAYRDAYAAFLSVQPPPSTFPFPFTRLVAPRLSSSLPFLRPRLSSSSFFSQRLRYYHRGARCSCLHRPPFAF